MPEYVTLAARIGKSLWLLLAGAVMVAGSAWLAFDAENFKSIDEDTSFVRFIGWVGVVFFGFCTIYLLACCVPGQSYLGLEREGFVIKSPLRLRRYRWADVASIGVEKVFGFDTVVVRFAPHAGAPRDDLRLKHVRYGIGVDDLAALLNEWRERAGTAPRP